jgi:hypothetical protein
MGVCRHHFTNASCSGLEMKLKSSEPTMSHAWW